MGWVGLVWEEFTLYGLGFVVKLDQLLARKRHVQLLVDHFQPFVHLTKFSDDGMF